MDPRMLVYGGVSAAEFLTTATEFALHTRLLPVGPGFAVIWLTPVAAYGLFAFTVRRRPRLFLAVGAAFGLVTTFLLYRSDYALSHVGCQYYDCPPSPPGAGFLLAVWAATLVPAVLLPLGLALLRRRSEDDERAGAVAA